ncbi:ABC transporter permease [Aneurinibacillus sp. Ricciae_BoGa-3]|uniref:ABC transporter permease n=1 Tax=Aneurinibacillus sp. Ricciae_BoGa-3 TaxID=3022697 RepID=UPI00234286E2|nr:ABC transporter permease [Aneurinibacillus sp. Ricciae_BoGa-3]WCK54294.1 ABC transporter permease [Aneurinibacillus sp. Ricciae_BoGa-3]
MTAVKSIFMFILDIFGSHRLIYELAKKDVKSKYLGSYLGVLWAFVQPTVMILIFWVVFQLGFRSMPVDNFPFILWLLCGMIPWFFFNDSVISAANSIIENSYLVKKVVFRVSVLPLIKIVSSLFIHAFFIVILFLIFFVYGYMPSIYNIQVVYYLIATIFLVLGISWITSSLVVFLKDIGQIIAMVLQFGFWLTPIIWAFNIVPAKYQIYFKLNPVFYIVQGYREAFIYHTWFWKHTFLSVYFWTFTFVCLMIGILLFKKLRPHFADVL